MNKKTIMLVLIFLTIGIFFGWLVTANYNEKQLLKASASGYGIKISDCYYRVELYHRESAYK